MKLCEYFAETGSRPRAWTVLILRMLRYQTELDRLVELCAGLAESIHLERSGMASICAPLCMSSIAGKIVVLQDRQAWSIMLSQCVYILLVSRKLSRYSDHRERRQGLTCKDGMAPESLGRDRRRIDGQSNVRRLEATHMASASVIGGIHRVHSCDNGW